MNILFIDTPAFGRNDMMDAMRALDLSITLFTHEQISHRHSQAAENDLLTMLEKKDFSFVYSFNYFPSVSRCCQKRQIPYVSYVYDSPLLSLFSNTISNPCNHIFLFDHALYERLIAARITTVYYLPLAANPSRLDRLQPPTAFYHTYSSDISFVGSLYNESHHLYERLHSVNHYTHGYLDAIMTAQLQISGYFMLEELLTPQIIQEFQRVCPYHPYPDGTESDAYVYANYFLARKLAEIERTQILQLLSQHYDCKLYTHQPTPQLPLVHNMGPIDNYETFPCICKCSKINLNITLRSIQNGIPMRAWDILGSGGFLLSNYQADYNDLFSAGEDYVYYINNTDLLVKTDYYLSHEKERLEIAANGHRKVIDGNTYTHRLKVFLRILGLTQD